MNYSQPKYQPDISTTSISEPSNSTINIQLRKTYKAPISTILFMNIIQITFYIMPIILIYWVVTLNWHMVAVWLSISLLQNILIQQRNQNYVKFVNKYFPMGQYLEFQRIYDCGKQDMEQLQKQKTLFCYHPHGVLAYGALLNTNHPNFYNQKLSKAYIISSNMALIVPLVGMHFKLWGVVGADVRNFKRLLYNNKTVALVPGGFQQATITTPKQLRVYIKKRYGFLKYAARYNYTIRQVLVLHQHKVFHTFDHFLSLRLFLNNFKIPGVFYWGKYGILYPPNTKIVTIIGKGIKFIKNKQNQKEPTVEQINQFHNLYINQLIQFYDRYKNMNDNIEMKIY